MGRLAEQPHPTRAEAERHFEMIRMAVSDTVGDIGLRWNPSPDTPYAMGWDEGGLERRLLVKKANCLVQVSLGRGERPVRCVRHMYVGGYSVCDGISSYDFLIRGVTDCGA